MILADNNFRKSNLVKSGFLLLLGLSVLNALGGMYQLLYVIVAIPFIPNLFSTRNRRVKYFVSFLFFIVFFLVVGKLFIGRSGYEEVRYFRAYLEVFGLTLFLYFFLKINTKEKIILSLIWYSVFQFIIAFFMFMAPSIRDFILSLIYEADIYHTSAIQNAFDYRGYGVSKHHLYGLSLALGLIGILCASWFLDRKKHMVSAFFLVSSTVLISLNARVGLVFIVVFLSFCLLRARGLNLLLIFSFSALTLSPFVLPFLSDFTSGGTVFWLLEVTNNFNMDSYKTPGTTAYDLYNMIHFPNEASSAIFGYEGFCDRSSACYSDIGYIRLIQMGGVVLLLLTLLLYTFMLYCVSCHFSGRFLGKKSMFLLLLVLYFVAGIKGDFYMASDFSRLTVMLFYFSLLIYGSDRQKKYLSERAAEVTPPISAYSRLILRSVP